MNSQDELLRTKAIMKKDELEKALQTVQSETESKHQDYREVLKGMAAEGVIRGEVECRRRAFRLDSAQKMLKEGVEALKKKKEKIQTQIGMLEKFLGDKLVLTDEIDLVNAILREENPNTETPQ